MTSKELADMLDGCEHPFEVSRMPGKCWDIARESNCIVVFANNSEDISFRGAIEEDIECDEDNYVLFNVNGGILWRECSETNCPLVDKLAETKDYFKIEFASKIYGYAWAITTDISHETFDVYNNGDKHCIGIVFSLDDINEKKQEKITFCDNTFDELNYLVPTQSSEWIKHRETCEKRDTMAAVFVIVGVIILVLIGIVFKLLNL